MRPSPRRQPIDNYLCVPRLPEPLRVPRLTSTTLARPPAEQPVGQLQPGLGPGAELFRKRVVGGLFRVGGAAFVDAGRVWGSDLTGFREDRDLVNVGLGLRLMSTRASSNRMLHIDFAVPLTSGDDIDGGLQISLQGKRGF